MCTGVKELPKLAKLTENTSRPIIRGAQVHKITGLSNTTIWREERESKDPFPRRVRLNEDGSAVGWFEDEIQAWVRARVRQAGKRPSGRRKIEDEAQPDAGGTLRLSAT